MSGHLLLNQKKGATLMDGDQAVSSAPKPDTNSRAHRNLPC